MLIDFESENLKNKSKYYMKIYPLIGWDYLKKYFLYYTEYFLCQEEDKICFS